MSTRIDADPDPLVAALQTTQAHLIAAERELRPVILFVEQRQRMRDRAREAKSAQDGPKDSAPLLETPTHKEDASPLERKSA